MEATKEIQTQTGIDSESLLALITAGDASKLNTDQKLQYYRARCEAAGLDYRAQPFQFIKLNGKEVLYALKSCSDQLAGKHGIVCEILSQVTDHDIRTVVVRARSKDGKQTDEIGCVSVKGYVQDALANAYMKSVTKAKRRAILSLCGLGMLDETEVEMIPGARAPDPAPAAPPAATPPPPAGTAHAPEIMPSTRPLVSVTVAKITKTPEGGFKAYDAKGTAYGLKDEAMAKALRALTGRAVPCEVVSAPEGQRIVSFDTLDRAAA